VMVNSCIRHHVSSDCYIGTYLDNIIAENIPTFTRKSERNETPASWVFLFRIPFKTKTRKNFICVVFTPTYICGPYMTLKTISPKKSPPRKKTNAPLLKYASSRVFFRLNFCCLKVLSSEMSEGQE
jgi:hypothetical protein